MLSDVREVTIPSWHDHWAVAMGRCSGRRLGGSRRWSYRQADVGIGLDGHRDPAMADGQHHSMRSIGGRKALGNGSQVVPDRALADAEELPDLSVRSTPGNVTQNLQMAIGEREGCRQVPMGRRRGAPIGRAGTVVSVWA